MYNEQRTKHNARRESHETQTETWNYQLSIINYQFIAALHACSPLRAATGHGAAGYGAGGDHPIHEAHGAAVGERDHDVDAADPCTTR